MIGAYTKHMAVLSVRLYIPAANSLKSKRMILRSIKDRIRSRFNVSVAELDGHDKWQTAVCDFAMIGKDRKYIDKCFSHIMSLIGKYHDVEVLDHRVEYL